MKLSFNKLFASAVVVTTALVESVVEGNEAPFSVFPRAVLGAGLLSTAVEATWTTKKEHAELRGIRARDLTEHTCSITVGAESYTATYNGLVNGYHEYKVCNAQPDKMSHVNAILPSSCGTNLVFTCSDGSPKRGDGGNSGCNAPTAYKCDGTTAACVTISIQATGSVAANSVQIQVKQATSCVGCTLPGPDCITPTCVETTCTAKNTACATYSCTSSTGSTLVDGCYRTFLSATTVCTGTSNGGACDGTDYCDGYGACVDGFRPSSYVCRAADGQCDVAETCSGNSSACPTDGFEPNTEECTGTLNDGACDDTDYCDGYGACVDGFQPSSYVCRAADGECDVEETCSGNSSACPTDGFEPNTKVCTGTSNGGACDGTDYCDGSGACVDGFLPSSYVCRAAGLSSICDPAEYCPGNGPNCPADSIAAVGTSCESDNVACTNDACDGTGDCTHQGCCETSFGKSNTNGVTNTQFNASPYGLSSWGWVMSGTTTVITGKMYAGCPQYDTSQCAEVGTFVVDVVAKTCEITLCDGTVLQHGESGVHCYINTVRPTSTVLEKRGQYKPTGCSSGANCYVVLHWGQSPVTCTDYPDPDQCSA